MLKGVPGDADAKACPAATARRGDGSAGFSRLANPTAADVRYVPLQSSGDDGITYLPCISSTSTGYYTDEAGMEYPSDAIYGPASAEEPGTCGPSESYILEYAYTQDCLDHDICV